MIRHGFDGGEELLKPVHLSQPVEGFPKTVLVTFQRKVVEALQKRLPVEAVSTISACVEVPIYRFSYQGQTLGLYLTTIGGPATVGILEEVWVKGAEKVLLFGTCGGAQGGGMRGGGDGVCLRHGRRAVPGEAGIPIPVYRRQPGGKPVGARTSGSASGVRL